MSSHISDLGFVEVKCSLIIECANIWVKYIDRVCEEIMNSAIQDSRSNFERSSFLTRFFDYDTNFKQATLVEPVSDDHFRRRIDRRIIFWKSKRAKLYLRLEYRKEKVVSALNAAERFTSKANYHLETMLLNAEYSFLFAEPEGLFPCPN